MIHSLRSREVGLDHPRKLQRTETYKRSHGLELSTHRDMESIYKGNINSLDIDLVEKRYLLSGGADGYIAIHDLCNLTGGVKYTCPSVGTIALNNRHRHRFNVETVLWYPLDTGMFISSGTDKRLKVWDTNRLKPADDYEMGGIIYNHHMSPVATRHCLIAVACQNDSIQLVDLKSGSATHKLRGHTKDVLTVRWSPNNEFILASGSADKRILLWDIRNSKGQLHVFDQDNGKRPKKKTNYEHVVTSHSASVNGLQFSSDGLFLISYGLDHVLSTWDTCTGRRLESCHGLRNPGRRTVQFAVSQGANPELVYVPNGTNIEVIKLVSGERVRALHGHFTQVNCCIFHPDSQELYSAGADRNILTWVPKSDTYSYDELVRMDSAKIQAGKDRGVTKDTVVRTVPVTADAWSSDEDDT